MKWPDWLRIRSYRPMLQTESEHVSNRRLVSPEGRERYDTWQREKIEVERRLHVIDAQTQVLLRLIARDRT